MRSYEIVFIVRPELSDDEAKAVTDKVIQWLSKRDGRIIKLENWGRRKLAYPIDHLYEGNYFFAQFEAEPSSVKGIEGFLNLQQEIIRYLVVRR